MELGSSVVYVDPDRVSHDALVTAIHGKNDDPEHRPSVNLVYVSPKEGQTDQYGRQIERVTSVVHTSNQYANGNFWREVDE